MGADDEKLLLFLMVPLVTVGVCVCVCVRWSRSKNVCSRTCSRQPSVVFVYIILLLLNIYSHIVYNIIIIIIYDIQMAGRHRCRAAAHNNITRHSNGDTTVVVGT